MEVSRRKLMQLGAGFLGTATLTSVLGINLTDSEPAVAQNEITPDQALEKLMIGNKRFVDRKTIDPNQDPARLTEVAKEQKPFASILCCSDSRVPPEIVFDQGLGDLFVVRDAGEVVTSEQMGSLEFGTLVLGTKVLLVLGHEDCGAVKAAIVGDKVPGQIGAILAEIEPAVVDYKGQQENKEAVRKAVEANVLLQLNKLKKSTVLTELINSGNLKIVGGYYDLDKGEVTLIT
ncbi:carbonic anhydrase [Stanieria sp. NIES-3757]|nr:carbonic anhydrase [Stanieria sp. NIES-3757]